MPNNIDVLTSDKKKKTVLKIIISEYLQNNFTK